MADVVVGLFSSYQDAEAALLVLQARGLGSDAGQFYSAGRHYGGGARTSAVLPEMRARDRAEYVAHGEHLGVVSGARRFSAPNWQLATSPQPPDVPNADGRERTLLMATLCGVPSAQEKFSVMCDHGALAVKDESGHWHHSVHRNAL
jgi:hypothetical protein